MKKVEDVQKNFLSKYNKKHFTDKQIAVAYTVGIAATLIMLAIEAYFIFFKGGLQ